MIKKAGHLKKVLSKYFAAWMGKGHPRWFLGWRGDIDFKGDGAERHMLEKVTGRDAEEERTHPLFRDCERGFALRAQLVDGLLESQMELLRDSIPERAQYILTWYGRKFNKMLQRPLTEKDYELREVGRPISDVKAFKVVRSVLFALGGGGAVVFTVFLVVEGLGDGSGGFIEFGGVGDVD